jgi:hypothetical protein
MPLLLAATMAILLTGLIPSAANAQERTFGITMGFPTSVGVYWKVADRFAVRPEFTFSKTKTDNEPTTWSVGTGVTGLIYLNSGNPLRTYLAPRFTYERQNLEDEGFFSTIESATHLYSLSGLFGAQYLLGDRFLVFGEVGVRGEYSSATDTFSGQAFTFSSEPAGYTLRSTGGVGIVFFF